MINRVILVGNTTREPQSLSTTGKAMTKLTIATNSHWRDAEGNNQESSEFHSVVCFGRLAETAALYCAKGRRVHVEGRLRMREYAAEDGSRRFATEVVADTVKLLQPRADTVEATPEEAIA